MRITVFTPAYNRGYIIEKLYRSLQRQSFRDFEWIVVDDGSTDNTETLFRCFLLEKNDFSILYEKTENGGKHRAINKGVALAKGELFYIVDSDDYITDNSLEIIDAMEKSIPLEEKACFGGVAGQKGYDSVTPIGKSFDGDVIDITSLERPKYNVAGDKAEVFYTEIMRKYPFPEIDGEKFVTECVVWDKIANDGFKLRFFNQIVMICNYLPDGLTSQGHDLFVKNPKGWGLYVYQSTQYGKLTGLDKWNTYLRYYGSLRDKISFSEIAKNLHCNALTLWLRLFGMRVFYKLYSK